MRRFALIFVLALTGTLGSLLSMQSPAHASAVGYQFTQTATAANISGDYTLIDKTQLNGNSSLTLFVTHNWGSSGGVGVYNNHPLGVWYTGSKWAIFNEDGSAMTPGLVFNVYATAIQSSVSNIHDFVDTATAANTTGSVTYINEALANNNPAAGLLVTPMYNPGGVCGCVYNAHPIGVFYDSTKMQWAIFNEDIGAMPVGASFNVEDISALNGSSLIQQATTANTHGDYTLIDSPYSNGKPSALLQVTQWWGSGVSNKHAIGVWYSTLYGKWAIYNEDQTPMTPNASFEVYIDSGIPI